ncbi:hypothetical protein GJ496_002200 [Pomphorhynchus laevis]|nr:hypothetical protein GJ496_002200 [Pomphorhynchus laevis]
MSMSQSSLHKLSSLTENKQISKQIRHENKEVIKKNTKNIDIDHVRLDEAKQSISIIANLKEYIRLDIKQFQGYNNERVNKSVSVSIEPHLMPLSGEVVFENKVKTKDNNTRLDVYFDETVINEYLHFQTLGSFLLIPKNDRPFNCHKIRQQVKKFCYLNMQPSTRL